MIIIIHYDAIHYDAFASTCAQSNTPTIKHTHNQTRPQLEAEIAAVEERALRAGVAGAPQGGPREERVAVWGSSNPSIVRQRSSLTKLLQELYVKVRAGCMGVGTHAILTFRTSP